MVPFIGQGLNAGLEVNLQALLCDLSLNAPNFEGRPRTYNAAQRKGDNPKVMHTRMDPGRSVVEVLGDETCRLRSNL